MRRDWVGINDVGGETEFGEDGFGNFEPTYGTGGADSALRRAVEGNCVGDGGKA